MQNDYTATVARSAMLVIVGIAAGLGLGHVAGLVSPINIVVSKECVATDLRCVLYSYQTLLAGLLALGGAAWTVHKIQKQIKLTRWQHGQEEIKLLLAEKQKIKSYFVIDTYYISCANKFGSISVRPATCDNMLDIALNKLIGSMNEATGDNCDVLIANRFIRNAQSKFISEIESCLQEIEQGRTEAAAIVFPVSAPNFPSNDPQNSVHGIYAERVFETDIPAKWRDAVQRANEARDKYFRAIDERIERIRVLYGQD